MNQKFDIKLCMTNGERLARIEAKLDALLENPCARCQNVEELTRLNTEMRLVKVVSGVSFTGLVGGLISWFFK